MTVAEGGGSVAVTATDHPSRDRRGLADRVGEAHRRARADRARRRPRRRARAGCARRRARAVAGVGRPAQPGRVAHGRRQAPRDRRFVGEACSSASTRSSVTRSRPDAGRTTAPISTPRSTTTWATTCCGSCSRVPSGALDRSAGRAHAAVARRPDDRRNRAGVSRAGADHRAAHRPREADARRGARPVRGPARRRARARGWRRCSRSFT